MQVQSLGWEDPLEKGMATHSSIFAWRIPWTTVLKRPELKSPFLLLQSYIFFVCLLPFLRFSYSCIKQKSEGLP